MNEYYTTGKFAKLANVTERTLRYYDKVGLLKPSFVADNGYRQYSQSDLLKLQKILLFKNLGFSLEDIEPLLYESNLKDSLKTQLNLVNKRIQYFQSIQDSLKRMIEIENFDTIPWDQWIEMINLISSDDAIVEQYKNSNNLNVRIQLHKQFSVNKEDWFRWVFKQMDFSKVNRLLEIGCGNGELWRVNKVNLRNREIFLSDISQGMIEDAKKRLSQDYSFMIFDCESIPFKKDFFDTIIANHVLFYVKDLDKGLEEIARTLKQTGILYCTTYGKEHMKEITDLVHEFDMDIHLSQFPLYERFGLENGKEILSKYFKQIECIEYNDELHITQAKPLVDYILSCHGNQIEKLQNRYTEFFVFVRNKIKESGAIKIKKQACLFKCLDPYLR